MSIVIRLFRSHREFRLLWIGETTSQMGNSLASVVMPLIAVTTLHASALTVSLLTAVEWLPWLVLGLLAGAWVDQLTDQRRLMILCDVAAAAAFASVLITYTIGDLRVAQLVVVAVTTGLVSVFFDSAYIVLTVAVVTDPAQRVVANSALQGSASVANIGGRGLGGLLVAAFSGPAALLADTASFLISGVCLAAIGPRPLPQQPAPKASVRQGIREGIAYVRGEPLLRTLMLYGTAANFALAGYQAILFVFLVRSTRLPASAVGLVLALSSLGGVAAGLVAHPLARRLGSARALIASTAAGGSCGLLIPLATSPDRAVFAVLGGGLVIAGATAGTIISATFQQNYVPAHLLARTSATSNVLNYGTLPIGAVTGGVLATMLGLHAALWITTALLPLAELCLILSPMRQLRDLPTRAP